MPACSSVRCMREAIRPHVFGRFEDMLLAVDAPPGHAHLPRQRRLGRARTARAGPAARGRGLNENLAREILELHTLTPAARLHPGRRDGVRQRPDRLARRAAEREPAASSFRAAAHEPGDKTVLGRTLPGRRGGRRRGAAPAWRATPRRTATSPPSSRATSSPTTRRREAVRGSVAALRDSRRRPRRRRPRPGAPAAGLAPPLTKLRTPDRLRARPCCAPRRAGRAGRAPGARRAAAARPAAVGRAAPIGWPDVAERMGAARGAAAPGRMGQRRGRPRPRGARCAARAPRRCSARCCAPRRCARRAAPARRARR